MSPENKVFQEGGHNKPWTVTCHLSRRVTRTARGALSTVPIVSSRSCLKVECRIRGRSVFKAPVALPINLIHEHLSSQSHGGDFIRPHHGGYGILSKASFLSQVTEKCFLVGY